jgi:ECF sigma factor
MEPSPTDDGTVRGAVTRALEAVRRGEPREADRLLPLVYDELRRLAAARLAREAPGQSLQPTALVHEAYLRLALRRIVLPEEPKARPLMSSSGASGWRMKTIGGIAVDQF